MWWMLPSCPCREWSITVKSRSVFHCLPSCEELYHNGFLKCFYFGCSCGFSTVCKYDGMLIILILFGTNILVAVEGIFLLSPSSLLRENFFRPPSPKWCLVGTVNLYSRSPELWFFLQFWFFDDCSTFVLWYWLVAGKHSSTWAVEVSPNPGFSGAGASGGSLVPISTLGSTTNDPASNGFGTGFVVPQFWLPEVVFKVPGSLALWQVFLMCRWSQGILINSRWFVPK